MAIDTRPTTTEPRSRRAILAGALTGLAGLIAGRIAAPDATEAAAGDPLILGVQTNNSGTTGTKLSTNGTDTGLYVQQNGTGTALRGLANNGIAGFFTSSNGTGVSGVTAKNTQLGVYGANDAPTYGGGEAIRANGQQNNGIVATTASIDALAVEATNSAVNGFALLGYAPAGGGVGVYGAADAAGGYGVVGAATGSTGPNFGVYGSTNSSGGYGVYSADNAYVSGDLGVTGTITAGTKDFRIDHPLDPAQKFLSHSCVESDDRRTVYDGEVTLDARGEATVTLPNWFGALNGNARIQLTPIGPTERILYVKAKVKDNRFAIGGGAKGQEVYWHLSAIRQDPYAKAHPLTVEAAKAGTERGRYLHPDVYGKPASKSIDALHARPIPAAAAPGH